MGTKKLQPDSAVAIETRRQFVASGRLGMARRWAPDDQPAQLAAEADMLRANAARLTLEAAEKLEHAARLDAKAREMREPPRGRPHLGEGDLTDMRKPR